MLGFTGIVLTEALAGKTVLQVQLARLLLYMSCLAHCVSHASGDYASYILCAVQFYGLAKGVDPAGLP